MNNDEEFDLIDIIKCVASMPLSEIFGGLMMLVIMPLVVTFWCVALFG